MVASDLPLLAKVDLASESDTVRLGGALARVARIHEVIGLCGPLGAGKTTLARGFVAARSGEADDVVSPTFTLVQVYDADGVPIWHFDLYRVERPTDVLELGWEEALSEGISLVEWPDRLGALLPPTRLDVVLGTAGKGRSAELRGSDAWRARVLQVTSDVAGS